MKNTFKKIICIITAVIISVVYLVVSASAEIIVEKNIYVGTTKYGNITLSTEGVINIKAGVENALTMIIVYYIDGVPCYVSPKNMIYYTKYISSGGGIQIYPVNGINIQVTNAMQTDIYNTVNNVNVKFGQINSYAQIAFNIDVIGNTTTTVTGTINPYSNYMIYNISTKSLIKSALPEANYTYKIFVGKDTTTSTNTEMTNIQSAILNGGAINEEYQVTRDSTTGKILTAGQPTNSENGTLMVSKGWYEDTTTIGNMMFLINDHDQKHNYTIKVSENKIIHSIIETQISNYSWYENTEGNWFANIVGNNWLPNWNEKLYAVFENLMTTVEWLKIKPYLTDMNDVAFDLKGYIKNDIMDFSKDDPLKRTKIVGVNLSDYINMVRYAVYKVELIDINENRVLDTTYIMANDTRCINSTKLGTVAWQYESNDTALNDLSTNNTPTSYISKINNGVGTYSSNYTTSDPGGYNNENVANIQDVITDINAYVDQVNGFFKAVYGLFPPEIWNIIYVGFGCVIAAAIIKILI